MFTREDTLAARFAAKVRRAENGCLMWAAAKNAAGYGLVGVGARMVGAHRAAWYLAYGSWPADCVLHRCDTPGCVEPTHLFEGSRADNNADCRAKGRTAFGLGGASLNARQASEIRRRLAGAPRGMVVQLAWEYGISQPAVSAIKAGRTWSDT